jgi:hypothetical protein
VQSPDDVQFRAANLKTKTALLITRLLEFKPCMLRQVRSNLLGTLTIIWPIVSASDDYDECGTVSGMVARGNS